MKKKHKKRSPQPTLRLNYIYFGLIFLLFAFMHTWSVLLVWKQADSAPWVFVGHAIVQAGVEALILSYVAAFLHARKARILEGLFISFTVVLCIIHLIDFHLVRLMDISIWYAMDFVLDESWRNFLELVIASAVPFSKIFLGLGILCCALIAAIWFFTRTQAFVVRKKGWDKILRRPATVLATGLFLLGTWEFTARNSVDAVDYERYTKALPWKRGMFLPSQSTKLDIALQPGISPQEMNEALKEQCAHPKTKPNIFLFVVETLREEFLTEESAPNLVALKNSNTLKSYSNSNATQVSWFSIFYSQAPVYFGNVHRSSWKGGSPILTQFKNAGYKLHLYSGSRLSYYGMNQVIFGEQYALVDNVYLDLPSQDRPAWQCDQAMVKHLCDDIHKYREEEGHIFIVFMESTHFDYSWPVEQETVFTPYVSSVNFVKAACFQDEMEELKNRYRNAIHYIDKLVGQFTTTLKEENRFDDSLVIITADHGEEFFEEGNLFHASALSDQQITVPIYFHMGQELPKAEVISHVDIMPTLLHVCMGEEVGQGIFYGQSVLHENRDTSAMTGRYNGSRSPHEFLLQNSTARLHARFSNPSCPERSKMVEVLSFEKDGQPVQGISTEKVAEIFGDSFSELFKTVHGPRT